MIKKIHQISQYKLGFWSYEAYENRRQTFDLQARPNFYMARHPSEDLLCPIKHVPFFLCADN